MEPGHKSNRPRVGLALSGGAARGIAHVGILRALEENNIPIDAIAGPMTVRATKAFQRRAGIAPDGRAGPATRRALGPLGTPVFGRRTLRRGAFGWFGHRPSTSSFSVLNASQPSQ